MYVNPTLLNFKSTVLSPQPTNFPGPEVALLRERPYYESSVAKKKAASQLPKMRRLDQLFLMDQLSIPPSFT